MRAAKIRRNMDLHHHRRPNAGVGQLIVDQLVEFLTETCGYSFAAVGVQIPAYTCGESSHRMEWLTLASTDGLAVVVNTNQGKETAFHFPECLRVAVLEIHKWPPKPENACRAEWLKHDRQRIEL